MTVYRLRSVEALVESRMRTHGAVLITGPKAVGKTTTARSLAASEVRLDQDRAALAAAQVDPSLVLDGEHPRLIDEYQLVDGRWSAVRRRVKDGGGKGLFCFPGRAARGEAPSGLTAARGMA